MGIFDKFFGKKDGGESEPSPRNEQPVMDLDELLKQVSLPCTTFSVGGPEFRPEFRDTPGTHLRVSSRSWTETKRMSAFGDASPKPSFTPFQRRRSARWR